LGAKETVPHLLEGMEYFGNLTFNIVIYI
jgi:hypothetical protein